MHRDLAKENQKALRDQIREKEKAKSMKAQSMDLKEKLLNKSTLDKIGPDVIVEISQRISPAKTKSNQSRSLW